MALHSTPGCEDPVLATWVAQEVTPPLTEALYSMVPEWCKRGDRHRQVVIPECLNTLLGNMAAAIVDGEGGPPARTESEIKARQTRKKKVRGQLLFLIR